MRLLAASIAVLTLALSVCAGVVVAQNAPAAAACTFSYQPPNGLTDTRQIQVAIAEVLLADMPTGATGSAEGVLKWSIVGVDPEAGQTTLRGDVLQVAQTIAGRNLNATLPPAVLLRLDPCARVVGLSQVEPSTLPAAEILSQGGLPTQALALLCALPPLPSTPVAVGDTWQANHKYTLPDFGEADLLVTTTLAQLEDGLALFRSELQASLPDFEAAHPLLPGQRANIRQTVIKAADFHQEYELERSLVRRAWGPISTTLEVVSPDMTLPLKVNAVVKYWEYRAPAP